MKSTSIEIADTVTCIGDTRTVAFRETVSYRFLVAEVTLKVTHSHRK